MLELLPIELVHEVAHCCANDWDLAALRATHPFIRNALDSGQGYFWRRRFASKYDMSQSNLTIRAISQLYKRRHVYVERAAVTSDRRLGNQRFITMQIITSLILDSYTSSSHSKNIQALERFCIRTDFVRPMMNLNISAFCNASPKFERLYMTLVVMLWPMACLKQAYQPSGVSNSRRYAYANKSEQPLILLKDSRINMSWIAHNLYFWSYLFASSDGSPSTAGAFRSLTADQKPRTWHTLLRDGIGGFGTHWKGSYAYLTDRGLIAVREGDSAGEVFIDATPACDPQYGDDILDWYFDFDVEIDWPHDFEAIVSKRLGHQSGLAGKHFSLIGPSELVYRGWISDLGTHENIPGWQRLAMVSVELDEGGEVIENSTIGYEAVITPGSQLMIGRWWIPSGECGPIIMWNVSQAGAGAEGEN